METDFDQFRQAATAEPAEDGLTKRVEKYTASVPSSAYLGVALGAMALSVLLQVRGRGKWGNFVAQWVPTWLIIGLYNKMVKVEGHDQYDRGNDTEEIGDVRNTVS